MPKTKLKQTITDCLNKVHNSEGQVDKALKELEEIESKDCETCNHKDNDVYLEACGACRNFYANMYEPKVW
jgi:hypothetical protein